ncbi:MFS transporter [Solimicrobium silvestre]|uniref:Major Facilitator Superfamily n=1 Tax=Solimicrobium silvestre TaxID=2099400 RepID=A0A2S9H2R9_9BURK|nr:MFS transporter [Solimicrobium silvestre]PRC94279.1 Major Facilitator Superfamily [Solimicrobium silvestre]
MKDTTGLSRYQHWLFCLATGFSVAAVVYHQAMTQMIAASFQVPTTSLWDLSVATQFGYGIGLILGLPLGDMVMPRKLIPTVVTSLGLVLLLVGVSSNLAAMTALCFLAGVLSIGGQLLIAYSAKTAAATTAGRPKIVDNLLSALFAGLLLARVLGGWGAEKIGWRQVYLLAGGVTVLLGLSLFYSVRRQTQIDPNLRYGQMLRRQAQLWQSLPELRRLALVAACFFAALNGIWANLASLTHSSLNWSASQTGLLAFTAVVALWAPALVRRLQQRLHWSGVIVLLGLCMGAVSLAGYWFGSSVFMIIIFLIVSDVSVRSVHVISQGKVLSIDPAAASRLNSLFMTVFFIGAALGSWLGGIAVRHFSWAGMYLFPLVCALLGVLLLRIRDGQLSFSRAL